MSTTDGVIDQKLVFDLEWINKMYYCLLPKIFIQMKHLPLTEFYQSLLAQINQHN